jgi:hypothetical protein
MKLPAEGITRIHVRFKGGIDKDEGVVKDKVVLYAA